MRKPQLSKKARRDLLLLCGICLSALVLYALTLFFQSDGVYLAVFRDGEEVARYALDTDVSFRLDSGDGGYNLVRIENGTVDMTEASCPDRICVRHRPIAKAGQTIICLPNRIILKIVGGEQAVDLES